MIDKTNGGEDDPHKGECLGRYAHKWMWVWDSPTVLSQRHRCMTCNAERYAKTGYLTESTISQMNGKEGIYG